MHHPGRAELAAQLTVLHESRDQPFELAVEGGRGAGRAFAFDQRKRNDVGLDLSRRNRLQLDLHRGAMLADRPRTLRPVEGLDVRRFRTDKESMARGPSLRPLPRSRFRRSWKPRSVESLVVHIAELVAERQDLRGSNASVGAIERNRIRIARAQWQLAHALIDRHLSAEPARNAA